MNSMKLAKFVLCIVALFALSVPAGAKVDLVTLPERESVQLTIYNSADITLVRDRRPLMLVEGENRLQFSWANTLIDPTSLDMRPTGNGDRIHVMEITYPPRVRNVGIWTIHSDISGEAPMEIDFFTSGLTWQSYYIATLNEDESEMELKGYVKVTNKSGEDYENAQVRLVVGEINLLDKIADLARRSDPYKEDVDRPVPPRPDRVRREMYEDARMRVGEMAVAPKEIIKEGLSEYFLYTIDGKETIPDGWSKRLESFSEDSVKVVNLYKFEEERFGENTIRFIHFKNDEEHNLGDTPLPDGRINVFKRAEGGGHLHYLGHDDTRYIPVNQDVELNLGPARKVNVQPTLMNFVKENFTFSNQGHITGFDEVRTYEIEARNLSDQPARIEIRRNVDTNHWKIESSEGPASPQDVDQDTFEYRLDIEPHTTETLTYTIRLYRGERANRR